MINMDFDQEEVNLNESAFNAIWGPLAPPQDLNFIYKLQEKYEPLILKEELGPKSEY
jgi:hypothetical protein